MFKGTIIANQAITLNTSSAMDGRALAFSAGVTFDGTVGVLPTPTAPVFSRITHPGQHTTAVVLQTTPYFPVTLQSSASLALAQWTTLATNTPATSPWTFTHTNILTPGTQNFYRAFITLAK